MVSAAVVLPWPDSPVVPKCPPRTQPAAAATAPSGAAPAAVVMPSREEPVRTELGQVGDSVRVSAVSDVREGFHGAASACNARDHAGRLSLAVDADEGGAARACHSGVPPSPQVPRRERPHR
jgi:hypothetical protein